MGRIRRWESRCELPTPMSFPFRSLEGGEREHQHHQDQGLPPDPQLRPRQAASLCPVGDPQSSGLPVSHPAGAARFQLASLAHVLAAQDLLRRSARLDPLPVLRELGVPDGVHDQRSGAASPRYQLIRTIDPGSLHTSRLMTRFGHLPPRRARAGLLPLWHDPRQTLLERFSAFQLRAP